MSDTFWIAAAGFGGSLVVGVVAVMTTRSAQVGENARARANFQHQLNVERGKRLRELYEPFAALHLELRRIAGEQTYVLDGETEASRNHRHGKEINEGSWRAFKVFAAVEVDPDTQVVKRLLHETSNRGYLRL